MPSPAPTQLNTPSKTRLPFRSSLKPSQMKSFMKRAGCDSVQTRNRLIAAPVIGFAVPAESACALRRNEAKSRNAAKPMPPMTGSLAVYVSS